MSQIQVSVHESNGAAVITDSDTDIQNNVDLREQINKNMTLSARQNRNNNETLQQNLEKEKQQNHVFPFRTIVNAHAACAAKHKITAIAEAIEDLNRKHNIRVFPRNGFLLGIIRHGGFLPNEKIDADLGVIFTDLEHLHASIKTTIGDFKITPLLTETNWVNWKGNDPITGMHYPFFCVAISRQSFSEKACSYYPYRENNFFYPRANIMGFNHAGNVKEMYRWNKEGANFRLVDTDEPATEKNFERGKQIGTVFPSAFDCMVEKQFYFTKIFVPCDYEAILQAQYGKNWHRVEKRSSWESVQISDEKNEEFIKNGPLPVCG